MKKILISLIVFCMLFSFAIPAKAQQGSVKVKVTTDKVYYLLGEPVKITYTVSNVGDSPVRFTFNTSQIYDFSIVDYGLSKLIYRWSLHKKFAQVITHLEIPAHSSKSFTVIWDQKSNTGNSVTVGGYMVNFWLVSKTPPGKTEESPYLASTSFTISDTVNMPFPDIADYNVQYSVRALYQKGLIKGYPDGTFKPNRHLTRAEGAVLILRLMGIKPSGNYKQDFTDVKTSFWGFKWIEEAYKRNIIKGTGNGKFSPNAEITRGEFVTMLIRAKKIPFVNRKNPFVDLNPSYFGYKEIITAYYHHIALGTEISGKTYFKPFSALTRGEAALFMYRALFEKSLSLKYSIKESVEEKPFEVPTEVAISYTPKVPTYKIEDVKNLSQYNLTDAEQNALKENGFFIKKSNYDTFSEFYEKNGGRPVFISFDTFLQAYHIIFDMSLRYDEIHYFATDLDELNRAMIKNSIVQYEASNQQSLAEAAKRNIAFFYIGEKLLNPDYMFPYPLEPNVKKEIEDIANKEITLINAHKGIAVSPLFGYKEDYSQYVPRGHYTRNETFKRYFKSMMWYGRMRFLLKPGSSKEKIQMGRSQTQSAILITLVLSDDPKLAALYDKIYEPTVFFVGRSDDINFYNYIPIVKAIYGETVSLNDLEDTEKLDAFIEKALALPNPKISTIGAETNEEKGFRFMGQRFTLDAYIFQNLVYPKAGYRMMPKAMDLFNVFGNKEAENIMLNVYNEKENEAYVSEVQTLRKEINSLTTNDWLENLYYGWLSLLKTYTKGRRGSGYPFFMQNENWAKKELFTALASFTELKHDTILYAKQSYTLMSPPPLSQPGYVEPNIEGYKRLLTLLDMTEKGLSERGILPDVLKTKIESLKSLTNEAITISKKELENTPLDKSDKMYFSEFKDEFKALMTFSKDFGSNVMGAGDGKTALVADIHTDPNSRTVLEEGVGNVFEIYVAARYNNELYLFRGPVFSYYEFTEKMSQRLTDEKWQSMVENGSTPDLPKWAKTLIP